MGMQYKKNYLTNVIASIQFIEPVDFLSEKVLPDNIKFSLKDNFPIYQSQITTSNNVFFGTNGIATNQNQIYQNIFYSLDRNETIIFNKNEISISFQKYKSYDEFKKKIFLPLQEVSKVNNSIVIGRTGLRYINAFPNLEQTYIYIKENFHSMIGAQFNSLINESNLTRNVNIIEYLFDDIKLRIQSGIFNQNFPAPIVNKQFLLDFDAYLDLPHFLISENENFEKLHSIIETKFEELISDSLKDFLNE